MPRVLASRGAALRREPALPPSPMIHFLQPSSASRRFYSFPKQLHQSGDQEFTYMTLFCTCHILNTGKWPTDRFRNWPLSRWTEDPCHRAGLLEDVPSTHLFRESCQGDSVPCSLCWHSPCDPQLQTPHSKTLFERRITVNINDFLRSLTFKKGRRIWPLQIKNRLRS